MSDTERIEGRNIKWDRGSIEEVKRWLEDEPDAQEDSEQDSHALDYPWPITVVEQQVIWGTANQPKVQTTLGFDEVPYAEDYEVRISPYDAPGTAPVSTLGYILGTGGHSIFGSYDITLPSIPESDNVGYLWGMDDGVAPTGGFATWTRVYGSARGGSVPYNPYGALWVGTGPGSTLTVSHAYAYVVAVFKNLLAPFDIISATANMVNANPEVTPTASCEVGDIIICGTRHCYTYLNNNTVSGTHTEYGFGPAISAFSAQPAPWDSGSVASVGVATSNSVYAEFGLNSGSGGDGENVTFVLRPVLGDPPTTQPHPDPSTPPPPDAPPPVTPPIGWNTVLFEDYFSGTSIDTSKWNIRNGTTQSNMDGMNFAANCTVANNMLSIRSGLNAGNTTYPWTCGYLDTIGKFSVQEGRWEARVRFPWGTTAYGYWPAFWLRPDDGGNGEIDIMEAWPNHNQVSYTIWHDYTGTAHPSSTLPKSGFDPSAWHVYAVEKEAGSLKFFLDDVMMWDATNAASWRAATFDRVVNWNIRLNLQIGGSWGGKPTSLTNLAQTYDIDYVRVLGR